MLIKDLIRLLEIEYGKQKTEGIEEPRIAIDLWDAAKPEWMGICDQIKIDHTVLNNDYQAILIADDWK